MHLTRIIANFTFGHLIRINNGLRFKSKVYFQLKTKILSKKRSSFKATRYIAACFEQIKPVASHLKINFS